MYKEGRTGLLGAIEGCTIRAHRAARLLIDGGVDDANLWDAAMEMREAQAAGLEYLGYPVGDITDIASAIDASIAGGRQGIHPLPLVRILQVGVTRILAPAYRLGTEDAPKAFSEAVLRFAEAAREEAVSSLASLMNPQGYDVLETKDGIGFPPRKRR
ncbi:MAG: hypothetical protein VR70_03985 [Rhodospirillaceae bacterium BRH_c57]|nr:MAG: hypothetical protein VR70_03985 [Rhodospirillaceae bacterium BRH_c57]